MIDLSFDINIICMCVKSLMNEGPRDINVLRQIDPAHISFIFFENSFFLQEIAVVYSNLLL